LTRTPAIYLFLIFLVMVVSDCARVGAPPGGEKDETPPEVTKSTPENYSVNFIGKSIEVTFDEYIRLNDINQKLIVSPPLETRPQTQIKGKGFKLTFEDDLKKNTTYTFNFSDAIEDNNEGNVLNNFQFVFSTGPKLDSLSFQGSIINAFDLQVPEDVYILLYDNLSDSAIFNETPLYVSKANEKGIFRLNNLKADSFHIYALQDGNMNYRYDHFPEMIAFSDTVLVIDPDNHSAIEEADSLIIHTDSTGGSFQLRLFAEEKHNQYLTTSSRSRKENLLLVFNKPLEEKPQIKLIEEPEKTDWFIEETFVVGDTVGYWLTDTTLINLETIEVSVKYVLDDSDKHDEYKLDTIRFRHSQALKKSRRRNLQTENKFVLGLNFNTSKANPLDLNNSLFVSTATPLSDYNPQMILFYSIVDSVEIPTEVFIEKDKVNIKRLILQHKWEEDVKYKIMFLPGFVTDLYGTTNDSTTLTFQTRKMEYYGNIIVDLNCNKKNMIIQLLDEKEKIIRRSMVYNDTILRFEYLPPKKYLLKAIWDQNGNGKWDTGNLIERIQPEKIGYYQEEIKLRSNWDFKKNWSPEFR